VKIVVVEDEIMVARRIQMFCKNILGDRIKMLKHFMVIEDAEDFINDNGIDLLLLDLNLNNRDGFDVLKNKLSASFKTIIISANTDRAIEAFEYGVVDFIGKPFKQERLAQAIDKLELGSTVHSQQLKFLSIKKFGCIEMIDISQVAFIQASGHYSELHLINGGIELHDKNLDRLLTILPIEFERVHKSYAVPLNHIRKLLKHGGSSYSLELSTGETIPLGRTRYTTIKNKLEEKAPFA
jgi:two-component system response regulator LytT